MDTQTLKRTRWFWPWQDEKEEGWLEDMSQNGWHLRSVKLPCVYTFDEGTPLKVAYRLDYMMLNKNQINEYLQIFQDAGWEYVGEMSNWRYWRKGVVNGDKSEIFTDNESKIKKYERMLLIMGFFLIFLTVIGTNMLVNNVWNEPGNPMWISTISLLAMLCYAVLIPVYVVVVVKVANRIRTLKQKRL